MNNSGQALDHVLLRLMGDFRPDRIGELRAVDYGRYLAVLVVCRLRRGLASV